MKRTEVSSANSSFPQRNHRKMLMWLLFNLMSDLQLAVAPGSELRALCSVFLVGNNIVICRHTLYQGTEAACWYKNNSPYSPTPYKRERHTNTYTHNLLIGVFEQVKLPFRRCSNHQIFFFFFFPQPDIKSVGGGNGMISAS